MRDPRMKRIGRGVYVCALPECGKRLEEITVKNEDPFCSVKCCHAYHGVEIQMPGRGVTVGSSS
jgi:hypothetical protein